MMLPPNKKAFYSIALIPVNTILNLLSGALCSAQPFDTTWEQHHLSGNVFDVASTSTLLGEPQS